MAAKLDEIPRLLDSQPTQLVAKRAFSASTGRVDTHRISARGTTFHQPVGAENPIRLHYHDFRLGSPGGEDADMALSFLYLIFVRVTQLIRLSGVIRMNWPSRSSYCATR